MWASLGGGAFVVAVVVGLTTNAVQATIDWTLDLMRPSGLDACLEEHLPDARPADARPADAPLFRVVITDLHNDPERRRSTLVFQEVRRLYRDAVGERIAVVRLPCALRPSSGEARAMARGAEAASGRVAERLSADLVVWGEVSGFDDALDLRLTSRGATAAGDYRIDRETLPVELGESVGAVIVAKAADLVSLTPEQRGTYIVPVMLEALPITRALTSDPPPGLTDGQMGTLWWSHGDATYEIGLYLGRRDMLSESIGAYEAALRTYTEGEHPVDWAATQNNLGNALSVQGARTAGAAGADLLARAVEAYEAALRVYTEGDHPVDWAGTQGNLGIIRIAQFDRTGDAGHLDAAERHVRDARAVFRNAGADHYVGMTDAILAEIARRRSP